MTKLALTLACVAALALSGCGSSTDHATDQGAEASSQGSSDYIVPSSDPISTEDSPSVAQHPKGEENDEVSESGAGEEDPCRLVSGTQASTILGEGVKTSVGVQGPTCIYDPTGSGPAGPEMTVAIEQTSLQALRSHASRATQVVLGSRAGWCLRYGSTGVVAPLPDGNVLHVTGPCVLASRFAAQALERITAS